MDQLFRRGRYVSAPFQRHPFAKVVPVLVPVAEAEVLRTLPLHEEGAHANDAGNYPVSSNLVIIKLATIKN